MAKFNSITEQLKGRECKVVLGVLGAAKSRVLKRWKLLDNSITDANNEAKDNVKCAYDIRGGGGLLPSFRYGGACFAIALLDLPRPAHAHTPHTPHTPHTQHPPLHTRAPPRPAPPPHRPHRTHRTH